MRQKTFLAFAAAFAAIPVPASATPEEVEIRIKHGDIDLASEADVAILRERIDAAIERACTTRSPLAMPKPKIDRDCVSGARKLAMAELDRKRELRLAMLDR